MGERDINREVGREGEDVREGEDAREGEDVRKKDSHDFEVVTCL